MDIPFIYIDTEVPPTIEDCCGAPEIYSDTTDPPLTNYKADVDIEDFVGITEFHTMSADEIFNVERSLYLAMGYEVSNKIPLRTRHSFKKKLRPFETHVAKYIKTGSAL